MHKRYLTVAMLSTVLLGGSGVRIRGAETNVDLGPTTQIATRAETVQNHGDRARWLPSKIKILYS